MADREKVIKGLEHCDFGGSGACYEKECPYYQSHDCTDELKNDILALLKEQEAKDQCLKTKCIICPHCDNCNVDENGLLKEQEAVEPTRVEIEQAGPLYYRCYCKKCGHHVGNMIKNKVSEVHENFCSSCGQAVKWE